MEKQLTKIFKRIRRYIHTQEWLKEIEQAFIKYWEHVHDKTLRNNRRIVNIFIKWMQNEFMALKTHWEVREQTRNDKKSNLKLCKRPKT